MEKERKKKKGAGKKRLPIPDPHGGPCEGSTTYVLRVMRAVRFGCQTGYFPFWGVWSFHASPSFEKKFCVDT